MKRLCCTLLLFVYAGCIAARADEQTRRVQEELRKRNLYFGDVDGQKTPEFAGALHHYQERKGFPPSGNLDAETLHSLGLAPAPKPSAAQRLPESDLSWPDVTVLRSDTHRREETPTVSTATPPSAAAPPPILEATESPRTAGERFPAADVREFIESYLRDAETNNIAAEIGYYADPLDYFDHGIVDIPFVERDVRGYYKRWPKRHYTLLDISHAPVESHADEVLVKFRINFSVKNDKQSAHGETDNSFILKTAAPNNFKIISMREQRVRPAPDAQ
jgi:hypothetical protein